MGFAVLSLAVKSGEQILMLKIKAGKDYYLSSYATYGGNVRFEKDKYRFDIEAGKINYIADISIKQSDYSLRTSVRDNESMTVAKAKRQAPWLFEKYPYVKSFMK